MSVARHHNEWLALVPQSGPFLSIPVLARVLPQGLDAHDPDHARLLKLARQEWEAAKDDPALHRAWVRFVLTQTLEMPPDVLAEGQAVPPAIKGEVAEYGETLRPDYAVVQDGKPLLLVHAYPADQDLDRPLPDSRWKASCGTRMMELLYAAGCRLGLVTNGDRWLLVYAPKGETTGFASWYAGLWTEEPLTLRAFRTLLSARRFFSVPEGETLAAMLKESASNQQEVTDQLGYQVRKAVEVLIQSLDRADQDHGRKLLGEVPEAELYDAALTVMMRLVFLFCAEERGLLLLGDPLYDQHYAVSPLRELLREAADQHGEEVLERRLDAWVRVLSTFRAVHGGVEHHRFTLPAYGGDLFDPDRFPFLEGRRPGTSWQDSSATPLPVNNRTVLHLLEALQLLQVKVPGGGPTEARRLSFQALDIEQVGHVYESLLDHTAKRATEPMLGLTGTKDKEPEVPLAVLEELREKGEKELFGFLKEVTGRSDVAVKKTLAVVPEGLEASRFRVACGNDVALWERVKPFAGLVRLDTFGYPVVIPAGSVYVTEGTARRATGTHYTPRKLAEDVVKYTLEPLVYDGPAETSDKSRWTPKSARDILAVKVCDIACGSGAFLVEACRYLSRHLMEAWSRAEKAGAGVQGRINFTEPDAPVAGRRTPRITPFGDIARGRLDEQIIPEEGKDREVFALRQVAQHCIYGVDKNPQAVEIAKLAMWLLTLAKGQPFTFLDHAIRQGDSLVGVHEMDQLRHLTLSGKKEDCNLFLSSLDEGVDQAKRLMEKLESLDDHDIEVVHQKQALHRESEAHLLRLRAVADVLIGTAFGGEFADLIEVVKHFKDNPEEVIRFAATARRGQTPFHWPLEFPQVFLRKDKSGFDAIIGNPPFMGGQKITGYLGNLYREYLVSRLGRGKRGSADLCAYFFLRAAQLIRPGAGFGLIASNTIAQGDTREVALDLLLGLEYVINRAVSSQPWQGAANLEVSVVWVRRGEKGLSGWNGLVALDDTPVNGITPFLTTPGTVAGNPYRLKANEGKSIIGSYVLGLGFVLPPEEAAALIAKDGRNKDVLFPYLNGEDLNSQSDQSPSRWVVNFFDWPEEKARQYPDCYRIVEEKVKPERLAKQKTTTDKDRAKHWWRYGRHTQALYRTIANNKRVLVTPEVSKYVNFAFRPVGEVFSHMLIVIPLETMAHFAVLQSSFHENWCRGYGSTLETRFRYTPSDCFETFPFPDGTAALEQAGERYYSLRQQVMGRRQEGLTKTYNRFHDKEVGQGAWHAGEGEFAGECDSDEAVVWLRGLHKAMDEAVALAYGWPILVNGRVIEPATPSATHPKPLDLQHGFHQTKQGVRFTISEAARIEVLGRLLTLNHERYEDEKRRGLHTEKKAAKGKKAKAGGGGLFE